MLLYVEACVCRARLAGTAWTSSQGTRSANRRARGRVRTEREEGGGEGEGGEGRGGERIVAKGRGEGVGLTRHGR